MKSKIFSKKFFAVLISLCMIMSIGFSSVASANEIEPDDSVVSNAEENNGDDNENDVVLSPVEISMSGQSGKPGDTITVSLNAKANPDVKEIGLAIGFDMSKFTFDIDSEKISLNIDDASAVWSHEINDGNFYLAFNIFNSEGLFNTDLNGFLTFDLKINDDVLPGEYTIENAFAVAYSDCESENPDMDVTEIKDLKINVEAASTPELPDDTKDDDNKKDDTKKDDKSTTPNTGDTSAAFAVATMLIAGVGCLIFSKKVRN